MDTDIEYKFDNAAFMADVRVAIGGQPSLRDISRITGISASAYSEIDRGGLPDMYTYLRTCARVGIEPGTHFKKTVWRKV